METAKEMEKKEEKREGVAYEKKGGKKGDWKETLKRKNMYKKSPNKIKINIIATWIKICPHNISCQFFVSQLTVK